MGLLDRVRRAFWRRLDGCDFLGLERAASLTDMGYAEAEGRGLIPKAEELLWAQPVLEPIRGEWMRTGDGRVIQFARFWEQRKLRLVPILDWTGTVEARGTREIIRRTFAGVLQEGGIDREYYESLSWYPVSRSDPSAEAIKRVLDHELETLQRAFNVPLHHVGRWWAE